MEEGRIQRSAGRNCVVLTLVHSSSFEFSYEMNESDAALHPVHCSQLTQFILSPHSLFYFHSQTTTTKPYIHPILSLQEHTLNSFLFLNVEMVLKPEKKIGMKNECEPTIILVSFEKIMEKRENEKV